MSDQEIGIELTYRRKYNLNNYNDKEYTIKIIGTQSQIEEQINKEKEKFVNYVANLESIIDMTNKASILKTEINKESKEEK
jgi:hypothetical protein